jgi:hypothetical protein
MGLVIIAVTTVAATLVAAPRARAALMILFTIGGAGYPPGYLLWSGLIPLTGLDRAKAIAETIVALWWLASTVALRCWRR